MDVVSEHAHYKQCIAFKYMITTMWAISTGKTFASIKHSGNLSNGNSKPPTFARIPISCSRLLLSAIIEDSNKTEITDALVSVGCTHPHFSRTFTSMSHCNTWNTKSKRFYSIDTYKNMATNLFWFDLCIWCSWNNALNWENQSKSIISKCFR